MFPPSCPLWKEITDGQTILSEFTLANMMNYFVTRLVQLEPGHLIKEEALKCLPQILENSLFTGALLLAKDLDNLELTEGKTCCIPCRTNYCIHKQCANEAS